ncbi:MAG: hypothetical protein AAGC97_06335 [Planctomycetota bacterium]
MRRDTLGINSATFTPSSAVVEGRGEGLATSRKRDFGINAGSVSVGRTRRLLRVTESGSGRFRLDVIVLEDGCGRLDALEGAAMGLGVLRTGAVVRFCASGGGVGKPLGCDRRTVADGRGVDVCGRLAAAPGSRIGVPRPRSVLACAL